jgi:hypothetical protein
MDETQSAQPRWFRLWIASYIDWRPSSWNQIPPRATAIEPVEDGLYSAQEAALFLEGFNSAMLVEQKPIWAVAVPITIRFEGDARPGMPVEGHFFCADQSYLSETVASAHSACLLPAPFAARPAPGGYFQGLGQSPQRFR